MQVLETNFNGYIHKVQMATHGLCVTSSDNETNVIFILLNILTKWVNLIV